MRHPLADVKTAKRGAYRYIVCPECGAQRSVIRTHNALADTARVRGLLQRHLDEQHLREAS